MKYLEPTDPDAFLDFPKKEFDPKYPDMKFECPKCFGHGGWNLRINAYGLLPGMEDTAKNRHNHSHFRSHCTQCNGWGWVIEAKTKCIHELRLIKNTGRCLNLYGCTKCDHTEEWDSSD